jgi:hypothetical protein
MESIEAIYLQMMGLVTLRKANPGHGNNKD